MRLSDLLGRPVTGPDGAELGRVVDLRLVERAVPGGGPTWVVTGLVVGRRRVGVRLGLDLPGVRGPAVLRRPAHWLDWGHAYVPWSDVEQLDPVVHVRNLPVALPDSSSDHD